MNDRMTEQMKIAVFSPGCDATFAHSVNVINYIRADEMLPFEILVENSEVFHLEILPKFYAKRGYYDVVLTTTASGACLWKLAGGVGNKVHDVG